MIIKCIVNLPLSSIYPGLPYHLSFFNHTNLNNILTSIVCETYIMYTCIKTISVNINGADVCKVVFS